MDMASAKPRFTCQSTFISACATTPSAFVNSWNGEHLPKADGLMQEYRGCVHSEHRRDVAAVLQYESTKDRHTREYGERDWAKVADSDREHWVRRFRAEGPSVMNDTPKRWKNRLEQVAVLGVVLTCPVSSDHGLVQSCLPSTRV